MKKQAKTGTKKKVAVKPRKPATARDIDDYLARLAPAQQKALQQLRRDIHAAAPGVEECISYKVPAFRLGGRMLVWFGAASRHCSFFPGAVVEDFGEELKGYSTSKGTVRFAAEKPLPKGLVRKLVRARMARIAAGR